MANTLATDLPKEAPRMWLPYSNHRGFHIIRGQVTATKSLMTSFQDKSSKTAKLNLLAANLLREAPKMWLPYGDSDSFSHHTWITTSKSLKTLFQDKSGKTAKLNTLATELLREAPRMWLPYSDHHGFHIIRGWVRPTVINDLIPGQIW